MDTVLVTTVKNVLLIPHKTCSLAQKRDGTLERSQELVQL
jgi:hypothetical protein